MLVNAMPFPRNPAMTRTAAATMMLAGLLAACTDEAHPPPPPPTPVATIEVTAPAGSMTPGATVQLTATARDEDGVALPGRYLLWTSDAEAVATVSPTGLVTAHGAGEVTIYASHEEVSGGIFLTVADDQAVAASIEVSPSELALTEGGEALVSATVKDAAGRPLEGRAVTWTSDDEAVVTVSAEGRVLARGPGLAVVTARCAGVQADLTVLVDAAQAPVAWIELDVGTELAMSAGRTRDLRVIAYDADGEVVTARPVTWSTSARTIATVNDAGRLTAHADGGAIITATVEGKTAELAVTVATVTSLAISRTDAVIVVDETLQLTAQPRDPEGRPLEREVTWTSDHPEYVAVDETGLITGVAEGGAYVTATSDGVSERVLVFVSRWYDHALIAVDGRALPTTMVTWTEATEGMRWTHSFGARAGTLRIRGIDGAYQLTVSGFYTTSGVATAIPFPYAYTSDGTATSTGTGYRFEPVGVEAPFEGTFVGNDGLRVVWQPDPRSPPVTLDLRFTP